MFIQVKQLLIEDDKTETDQNFEELVMARIYEARLKNGNLFSGSFDGAGHSVTGLYISRDADRQGFFGALATSADIRCLTARATNNADYAERVFTLKVNEVPGPSTGGSTDGSSGGSSGGCSAGASALELLALRARRRRTQGR